MKITKFEQSCLLVEEGDNKLLIDPGTPFSNNHQISELGILDAVLITHEHTDHFDANLCNNLPTHTDVYVNESTSKQLSRQVKIVGDGELISVGNLSIKVIELPHCLMPDGSEGPQNIGFLINDKLFHPGDGIELEGLSVETLALPINGPDVSMKRAFQFARQVSAQQAIAIHYDIFGANVDLYRDFAKRFNQPFELKVLQHGESVEL
ncbi:MAG TPA: MBL fold metallo-hydrolase [Patescibacteria group bacterium]|nr:MBL fold metallo-hydrolase [Patescibacteria group bacterium]